MYNLPDIVLAMTVRHRFLVYKGKSMYLRQLFCCEDKCTWDQDYYCVVICTSVVVAENNSFNKRSTSTQSQSVPVSTLPMGERVRLG